MMKGAKSNEDNIDAVKVIGVGCDSSAAGTRMAVLSGPSQSETEPILTGFNEREDEEDLIDGEVAGRATKAALEDDERLLLTPM